MYLTMSQCDNQTGNSRLEAGPVPISRLGLPPEVRRVDAAMVWGWNGRTYLFSGGYRTRGRILMA